MGQGPRHGVHIRLRKERRERGQGTQDPHTPGRRHIAQGLKRWDFPPLPTALLTLGARELSVVGGRTVR